MFERRSGEGFFQGYHTDGCVVSVAYNGRGKSFIKIRYIGGGIGQHEVSGNARDLRSGDRVEIYGNRSYRVVHHFTGRTLGG